MKHSSAKAKKHPRSKHQLERLVSWRPELYRKVLCRKSHYINERNWWYEERGQKHITLIHEVVDRDGAYIQTDTILIPLKKLHCSHIEALLVERKKKKAAS